MRPTLGGVAAQRAAAQRAAASVWVCVHVCGFVSENRRGGRQGVMVLKPQGARLDQRGRHILKALRNSTRALVYSLQMPRAYHVCVCVYMWFGQRRQNTELERHRHRHADTHLERVSEVQSSAVDGNSRDGCLQLLAQCPHLLHTRGNRSSNVIRGLCTHTAEWELAEARGERRQHSAARAQPQGTRWGKGKAGGG